MSFTTEQLNWASEHDWFIKGDEKKIVVMDTIVREDEYGVTFEEDITAFKTFNALYIWAGY